MVEGMAVGFGFLKAIGSRSFPYVAVKTHQESDGAWGAFSARGFSDLKLLLGLRV